MWASSWAFTRRALWPLVLWAWAYAAAGTFTSPSPFLGWFMRRWWNTRRGRPGAGPTQSACPWCLGLTRACGRYSKWHCCHRSRFCLPGGVLAAAQPEVLYDESYRRMDEWRDVDLDGARCSGSGPPGRHDYQAVQEIVSRSRPACEVSWCHE